MARIMGIDYGTKRVGLAVSDPLQIIAGALDVVPTLQIFDYLKDYMEREEVECIVVGDPLKLDNTPGSIAPMILGFVRKIKKLYPQLKVERIDERYTSKDAERIIRMGSKKKKRRDKGLVDKVSAVLILQEYMEANRRF